MIPNLLSIAGSDPSGGAGIQADLKTFGALGCYGMAVLTSLTAQNTRGVSAVHLPPPDFLRAQIEAIFADVRVDAVKVGMLGNRAAVETVAECLRAHPVPFLVVDPVLVATSGDSLGTPDVVEAVRRLLLPMATVITPNLPEAARLAGTAMARDRQDMRAVGRKLVEAGGRAVLVKGGHLGGPTSVDVLVDGDTVRDYEAERVETTNTHGTGCTLSSAIAAFLAKGDDLGSAIERAKAYLTEALRRSGDLSVGGGHGPLHHFHALEPTPPMPQRGGAAERLC